MDKEKWLSQLQIILDSNGIALDLSKKEDLARLVIINSFEIEDGYDVNMTFAMDAQQKKIDLKQDDEEFEYDDDMFYKGQGSGNIADDENLNRLFDAAKTGKLYIAPIPTDPHKRNFVQLGVDEYSTPTIGTDYEKLKGKEKEDFEELSDERTAPVFPKDPGFLTKLKSFFGNKKARSEVDEFNTKKAEYYEEKKSYENHLKKVEKIKEKNPKLVEYSKAIRGIAHNMDNRLGATLLQRKLTTLHDYSQVKGNSKEEKDIRVDQKRKIDELGEMGRLLSEIKGVTLKSGEKLDNTTKQTVAKALINLDLINKSKQNLAKENYDKSEIVSDTSERSKQLYESPLFQKAIDNMTGSDLMQFADVNMDGEKALKIMTGFAGKFYKEFNKEMQAPKEAQKNQTLAAGTDTVNIVNEQAGKTQDGKKQEVKSKVELTSSSTLCC